MHVCVGVRRRPELTAFSGAFINLSGPLTQDQSTGVLLSFVFHAGSVPTYWDMCLPS